MTWVRAGSWQKPPETDVCGPPEPSVPVSNVGEGFWLARGIRSQAPHTAALPVMVDRVGGGDALVVWGWSVVPEYGGGSYRTIGRRLDDWLRENPDVTFVPDRDRRLPEAPKVTETPRPDFDHACTILRIAGNERRERARKVRAAREFVLDEFGTTGLARLENGTCYGSLEEYAKVLEADADGLFAAADRLARLEP